MILNAEIILRKAIQKVATGPEFSKNISFLYHSINRNGSSARNTGAINSTGEYLSY